MNNQVTQIHVPKDSKNIVIFIHGFGVRWDSRGMFSELAQSLPEDWGNVLFDFYDIKGDNVYITDIDQQVRRLSQIIKSTQSEYPQATLHLIAHSKGCIITAIAQPEVSGCVILLAPPENFGTRIESYFRRYPGAIASESGLIIPRKDGTTTHIPADYFAQTAKIQVEEVLLAYSTVHAFALLQTTKDEVIGETHYERLQNQPNITISQLAADHNFTKSHRAQLIGYIKTMLGV